MGFVFRDDRGDENGPPSVDGRGFQAVAFDDPLQDAQQGRALLRRQGVEEFGIIGIGERSEEHTSELQSLMRNSYAVFCLKKKKIIRRKICCNIRMMLNNKEQN